jgi:hypothetical protein
MGALDEILKKHKAQKEEEKRQREETAARSKNEKKNVMAEFKKCVDEIILPILSEYKESLSKEGYLSEIINALTIDPAGPEKQFYDKVIFKFDTEEIQPSKEFFYTNARSIIFQRTDRPNVTVNFDDHSEQIECNDFFIRQKLEGIFNKVFKH